MLLWTSRSYITCVSCDDAAFRRDTVHISACTHAVVTTDSSLLTADPTYAALWYWINGEIQRLDGIKTVLSRIIALQHHFPTLPKFTANSDGFFVHLPNVTQAAPLPRARWPLRSCTVSEHVLRLLLDFAQPVPYTAEGKSRRRNRRIGAHECASGNLDWCRDHIVNYIFYSMRDLSDLKYVLDLIFIDVDQNDACTCMSLSIGLATLMRWLY